MKKTSVVQYFNCVTFLVLCISDSFTRAFLSPLPCLSHPSREAMSESDTWRKLCAVDPRWEDEIEERAQRRALEKSNVGETAAGAVLGSLVLGPFGAIWGASIGANVGAKNAMSRARQEEMNKMGISQEMLDSAKEIGKTLEDTVNGMKASEDSLFTQQRLARRLDEDAQSLYERASSALKDNAEDLARDLLVERHKVQEKLKDVLKRCAEERRRLETLQSNADSLEQRAMEVDALLRRSVASKTLQETQAVDLSLRSEDPLLQKFKDLGID